MSPATSPQPIPLMHPFVPEAAIEAVTDILRSRWIGQGPKVDEFERDFQKLAGARECVAVGSCTDALHLAYILAGIGPGDEVITPLFTCTATNMPLLWMGAEIKFADVGKNSLNIDVDHVRQLITPKTKAIVVVHYGGTVALVESLWKLGIPVIEDCAQALGATYPGCGLPVGTESAYGCFSFQAVKHITTGDGGMLLTSKAEGDRARRLRWFGIDRKAKLSGTWANDVTEVGYKYQMTDIAAAMGIEGLRILEHQVQIRQKLLEAYRSGLVGIPGISLLAQSGAAWLCTVLVENRTGLQRKLSEYGIESDPVHYRNDRYSIFARFRRPGEFPNMDAVEDCYLCLPLHMHMDLEQVSRVCYLIRTGW